MSAASSLFPACQKPSPSVHDRDAVTLKNQRDSPLLRLPAELRNKICAIISEETSIEWDKSTNEWVIMGIKPLRLTCRQINCEAHCFATPPTTLNLRRPFEKRALVLLVAMGRCASITTIELDKNMRMLDRVLSGAIWTIVERNFRQNIHNSFVGLRRVVIWQASEARGSRKRLVGRMRKRLNEPKLEVVFR